MAFPSQTFVRRLFPNRLFPSRSAIRIWREVLRLVSRWK